jgi:carbohydrate kinase (thermoresistant glucokinase family)
MNDRFGLPAAPARSLQIIVMGVSGCGKSTLANALAKQLGLAMVDGDDLHLSESVAKMRAGIALEDADRWPWLQRIGDYLSIGSATQPGRIVACSALKRAYRDHIRQMAPGTSFIFLDGDGELIRERLSRRTGHYMKPDLLSSQLRTLERPAADEGGVITLDLAQTVDALVVQATQALIFQPSR